MKIKDTQDFEGNLLSNTKLDSTFLDTGTAGVTSPSENDILEYNGTNWINKPIGDIELAHIEPSTYTTVQHLQDIFHSAGYVSGGLITANGTDYDVAAGTGLIRDVNTSVDTLFYFDWVASAGLTIAQGETKYVGVDYNAGSPQILIKTSYDWNYATQFPLGTVIREADDTMHIIDAPHAVGDHANFMIQRLEGAARFRRDEIVGGLAIGEGPTRHVTLSAGRIWYKLRPFDISAVDTEPAGTTIDRVFDEYYRKVSDSGWNKNSDIKVYNNTLYDNNSGTLATLVGGHYGVRWWYVDLSDGSHPSLVMVYGQADHNNISDAQHKSPPASLPSRLNEYGVLVGRFIFKQNTGTSEIVESALNTFFTTGTIGHNSLSGLDGGTTAEYFHLTSAQHTIATTVFSVGSDGLVPDPVSSTGKFLKDDGTWDAVGGSGTVTSVALSAPAEFTVSGSPITTSGTLTITKAVQSANQIYAGPASGGDAAPTFRTMVTDDIADDIVTYAKIQNVAADQVILGNDNGAGQAVQELTATEVRSLINVADGANNYSHPNHTGDVTSTGDGATVISAKAVDIAMLADGTDGELITWDAAGVATTVAVGTATHVLTSNGAGPAPTFQAAASGIEVDNQQAIRTQTENVSSTASASFVTGGSRTITTSNTQSLDYHITCELQCDSVQSNQTLTIELWVDGSLVHEMSSTTKEHNIVSLSYISALTTGKVVELKYRSTGNATITRSNMVMQGIG